MFHASEINMLDISQEQAYQRAYHLKQHHKKLEEIKKKNKSIDNQLSSNLHNLPKRIGYRSLFWAEKVNRENQILLDKLIKIKLKKQKISHSLIEVKSLKPKDFQTSNDAMFCRLANVNPSLSTKHILKDYGKVKGYLDMRNKIFQKRILSVKNFDKVVLTPINYG